MQVSQKLLDQFKALMKKKGREYKSDDEARGEAQSLVNYVEFAYEVAKKEVRRKNKLKDHPKGYPIDEDGTYGCFLCSAAITRDSGRYDKYGFKCLDCQRAVDKKLIPVRVLKDRESWFADWQIQSDYGVHPATRGKLRRQGLLHGIDLKTKEGLVYYTVFLCSDNQEFLKKYPKKEKKTVEFIYSGGKKIQL